MHFCTIFFKGLTNALGFVNVILLHSNHLHVSAIRVAIYRVMRTIIQMPLKCV